MSRVRFTESRALLKYWFFNLMKIRKLFFQVNPILKNILFIPKEYGVTKKNKKYLFNFMILLYYFRYSI